MCTDSYEFARKAALRRVRDSIIPAQEAPQQPTYAKVEALGDVLFEVRRLVEVTKSGTHLVRLVVDKDWHPEDSPFKVGVQYDCYEYQPA
jgi:hypothetical protein